MEAIYGFIIKAGYGFIAVFVAWLSFCIRIIKENERAIKIFLGHPGKTVGSGPCFIFWPFQKLIIYPTTQQELDVKTVGVTTKKGRYKSLDGSEDEYSAATVTINPVVYFFWPEDLRKAVVKGPDPRSPESIKNFFEEVIIDAVRIAGGERTWRECVEERKKLAKRIGELLGAPGNPFCETEITEKPSNLYVAIKELKLPDRLEEALTAPEIAKLKADAREKEGEGEKKYLTLKGQGEAAARDAIFSAIERGGIAKETLLTLREMAQGTSNTILFGLPPQLYETLTQALGGRRPEDLLNFLSKEQKEDLVKYITEKLGGRK